MIEQAIFAAIGFLAATLLALAAAPAVAHRARRLAAARARLLAPLSESQAIADRDALRAQHAVDLLRLERRLEAANEAAAVGRIELGRQLARIVQLEESTSGHSGELVAARREAEELRAELGAAQLALADLAAQRDRVEVALRQAKAQNDEIVTLSEERRGEIATLATRVVALEARAADAERAAAAPVARATAERERLAAALAEAETRLAYAESAREEAVLENRRQLARLAERESAPAGAALPSSVAAVASSVEGDKALRAAIARLGRDVARLDGRRRIVEPEPITISPPPLHPASAGKTGKVRHGEPAAREG